MTDAEQFLAALARGVTEEERLIICGFPGDPDKAGPAAWKPRPWAPGKDVNLGFNDNAYITVSSFGRAGDGSFRRRGETFRGGLALMVDDVGTKVTAHDDWPAPSAAVETSPGNYQWWYFLVEPERDQARFDGVIRAFISGKLLGADPGMSGVTRVGRIPGYVNGKPKYGGEFRVRLQSMVGMRYTTQDLLDAFGLKINGQRVQREKLPTEEAIERNRAYGAVFKFLDGRNMLKRTVPDPSGWTEMHCPWMDDHTGKADTGAAIREPAPENDYYGAFRCHHGHCMDKGWAELTDWVNELAADALERAADSDHAAPRAPCKFCGAPQTWLRETCKQCGTQQPK